MNVLVENGGKNVKVIQSTFTIPMKGKPQCLHLVNYTKRLTKNIAKVVCSVSDFCEECSNCLHLAGLGATCCHVSTSVHTAVCSMVKCTCAHMYMCVCVCAYAFTKQ